MIKVALVFVIIGEFVLFIVKAVSWIFQRLMKKDAAPEPTRRDWYGTCESCGKRDGLHSFQGKRYCAMCHARIKSEYDFTKEIQTESIVRTNAMSILKEFDLAIANVENIPRGFVTSKGNYDSYMSNAAWDAYLKDMSDEHRSQFEDGSGGELKEKNDRPPKMASFASSSRMAYQLSKDIPNFVFEKQLSTEIGGTANLDGYWEGNGRYIFVEAKCREPYSHKSPETIRQNYKPLYGYLQSKLPDMFSCTMEDIPGTRDMRVEFFCNGKEIIYFDMKQMLCHLLGVANRMLLDKAFDTPIQFLYLLYNPIDLALSEKAQKEILSIYHTTCESVTRYDFRQIFACIVDFLIAKKVYIATKSDVEKLKHNFAFFLCDQNNYLKFFVNPEQ